MSEHALVYTGAGHCCSRCGLSWDSDEVIPDECLGAVGAMRCSPSFQHTIERVPEGTPGSYSEDELRSKSLPQSIWAPAPKDPMTTQEGGTHYRNLVIQPTEFCQRNGLDFCIGSILKYVSRHRAKNGAEDLRKARHFVEIRESFPFDIHPLRHVVITMGEYVDKNGICSADAEVLFRLEAYYNGVRGDIRDAAQRVITEIDRLIETTY